MQGKLDLGTVESPLARLQVVLQAVEFQRLGQRSLGTIPGFIRADTLLRTGRELDHDVFETEGAVDVIDHADTRRHLFHDLLFGTEDVGVILGETPNPHQAVQGA